MSQLLAMSHQGSFWRCRGSWRYRGNWQCHDHTSRAADDVTAAAGVVTAAADDVMASSDVTVAADGMAIVLLAMSWGLAISRQRYHGNW